MSVESWNPNQAAAPKTQDTEQTIPLLKRFSSLAANTEKLDSLATNLSEQEQQQNHLMNWEQEQWPPILKDFSDDELIQLIKFFTLIEMQLSGWQAGHKSPVIAINRELKKRGERLDKELLIWIRENSNNRFIPNGAIL